MTTLVEPARPFFLPVGSREIFCLHHVPAPPSRGAVVYVPPFTEEMNKARRMAALQARALAVTGWHVLQFDLAGTGDSEGDFSDATWAGWLDDVATARGWLRQQTGHEPWLWGLRLGALIATASLGQRAAPGLVVWQPVLSGRQHLQQFLRLRAGAEWLSAGREAQAQVKPMEQLLADQAVEVGGYMLGAALARPMADAVLTLPAGLDRIGWFEVSPHEGAGLAPAGERLLGTARAAGIEVSATAVRGPSFWQSLEIETAPSLLLATCAVFAA